MRLHSLDLSHRYVGKMTARNPLGKRKDLGGHPSSYSTLIASSFFVRNDARFRHRVSRKCNFFSDPFHPPSHLLPMCGREAKTCVESSGAIKEQPEWEGE